MSRVKLSVPLKIFSSEIRKSIQSAVQLGVHGVQVDLRHELVPEIYGETARRQLLHMLSQRDLQLSSAHFPLRSPLIAVERLSERIASLSKAIDFASKLNIRKLTLRLGRLPSVEEVEATHTLHSILSELAGQGNQRGVTLCIIPCGDSAAEMRALIDSIKTGPVQVDADLGAWILNRNSVATQMRELHDLIGHFEIRDAIRDVDGRGREAVVGQGEIDWDEVMALIGEMGYSGWLNVDRTEGSNRLEDVARAVAFMQDRLPHA